MIIGIRTCDIIRIPRSTISIRSRSIIYARSNINMRSSCVRIMISRSISRIHLIFSIRSIRSASRSRSVNTIHRRIIVRRRSRSRCRSRNCIRRIIGNMRSRNIISRRRRRRRSSNSRSWCGKILFVVVVV